MDLRSEYPFWLLKEGIIHTYPSAQENIETEISIIGAGITGALMAYHLGKAGFNVVVVDRRHVGMGSTAATTGLLQYEIDTPLRKLISLVGEKHAVRSYELCAEAIDKIGKVVTTVGVKADFEFKPSFQYASQKAHVKDLQTEYQLRKKYRISEIEWVDSDDIKKKFGFTAPAGVLSAEGAQVNAYNLTHHLLKYCIDQFDLRVYDSTEIVKIKGGDRKVELKTKESKTIRSRHVVVCAGYESESYLKQKVEIRNTTYAIVSEPFASGNFWYEDALIWETAVPYLYMRSTRDNRILVGGRDDNFYNPGKRDRRLPSKAKDLVKDFNKKFPGLPFKIDFEWAGTFCGTKDGLPYIGTENKNSAIYFALGFGGNGITFSLIAAEIITDMLMNKRNEDANIFSFSRP